MINLVKEVLTEGLEMNLLVVWCFGGLVLSGAARASFLENPSFYFSIRNPFA